MIFKRKMQEKVISKFFRIGFLGLFVVVFAGCPNEEEILVKKNDSATGGEKGNVASEKKNSIQNSEVKGQLVSEQEEGKENGMNQVGNDLQVKWVGVNDVEEAIKGQGTKEDPYQIAHPNHFERVRANLSAHYKVVKSLDLSGIANFKRIGTGSNTSKFYGKFDGGRKEGHIIKGLRIDGNENFVGFFGFSAENSLIQNVKLIEVNVKGSQQVGGLVGRISGGGIVKNIWVSGNIEGNYEVGGLVGSIMRGGKIEDSYSSGTVSGKSDVGGIVGKISAIIIRHKMVKKSESDAEVIGTKNNIGGIAGSVDMKAEIIDSEARGRVVGGIHVGGLVGWMKSREKIQNSRAKGAVEGKDFVGGLVGRNQYGEIVGSQAEGIVTGKTKVGSLVGGNAGKIKDSSATGLVGGTRIILVGEDREQDRIIEYVEKSKESELRRLTNYLDGYKSKAAFLKEKKKEKAKKSQVGGMIRRQRPSINNRRNPFFGKEMRAVMKNPKLREQFQQMMKRNNRKVGKVK